MTLDGFLTFLGLMIATYAIMSPLARLRLKLSFHRQLFLAALAILLVFFFLFFFELEAVAPEFLHPAFDLLTFTDERSSLTTNEFAFLVVIGWMALAALAFSIARPNPRSLHPLNTLVARLHDEGRYLELVDLTLPFIQVIHKTLDKQNSRINFHYKLRDAEWLARTGEQKPNTSVWRRVRNRLLQRATLLSRLFPRARRSFRAAQEIENLLLESDEVREVLVRQKPQFAAQMLTRKGWSYDEYRKQFFRLSLPDTRSSLVRELRDNQNIDGFGYVLNPKNTILDSLFSDAAVARDVGIWKPIGDEMIRNIRDNEAYRDVLNRQGPPDDELWSDPTLCGVHFFDIMVTSAAKQGIADHMWLMYAQRFVDLLEEFHDPIDGVDLSSEFPTLGCRIIWEITCCQSKWVALATELPPYSPHVNHAALRGKGEASIPFWAVNDYARTIRRIATSDRLPTRFVSDRFEGCIRTISRLPNSGYLAVIREKLIRELIHGNEYLASDDIREELRELSRSIDHVVLYDAPDFVKELDKPACTI